MKGKIKRLLIVMLVICVINIAFVACFLWNLYQTRRNYEKILNQYIVSEEDVLRLSESIYRIQALTLSQLLSTDDEIIESMAGDIKELDSDIRDTFSYHSENLIDDDEKDLFHEVYSDYIRYMSQQGMLSEINLKSSRETANYYVNTVMKQQLSDINGDLKDISEYAQEKIAVIRDNLDRSNHITNVAVVFAAIFSVAIITGLLVLFTKFSDNIIISYNAEQKQHEDDIIRMQHKTIEGMAELVESRDGETGEHVRRTAYYVEKIAEQLVRMGIYTDVLTPEYIEYLKRYAPLHDVGKIVVSDTILLKPARLTKDEFERMKVHTVEGGRIVEQILSDIETPERVKIAQDIATYHHEKWDGSGYPFGLSGEDIPLCARIMSVADVFDALTSVRCYKEAYSLQSAYDIIESESGKQFDPNIVKAFFELKPGISDYLQQRSA